MFTPSILPLPAAAPARSRRSAAFTLIELLTVMGMMAVMMALVLPAVKGIKGSTDLTSACENISGILDQARTYAMANNTHVFVGFAEVNGNTATNLVPQVSGTGRVMVAVVASKNGTNLYGTAPATWNPAAISGSLVAISALQSFQGIHLSAAAVGTTGGNGDMMLGLAARPLVDNAYQVGNAAGFSSMTSFYWPLGVTTAAKAQCNFQAVIEFDPQGGVWYQPSSQSSNGASLDNTRVQYLEIGLQPAAGTLALSSSNVAAIQIDGVTGTNRIYRP